MLGELVNALAPDVPPVADFQHHWNSFLKYYGENGSDPQRSSRPVEMTHQVHHLNCMMKVLAREQKDHQGTHDGIKTLHPCMEFLINHQMLDILSTLCQADVPPGLRPHLIRFFVFIVGHVDQVILPYVSVYLPIRRILALFCSCKASPTESQEIGFIITLLANLSKNSDFLTLFAHQPAPGDVSHSSSSKRVSRGSSTLELNILQSLESSGLTASHPLSNYDGRHLLASTILNFVDSADYMVACQAMEALIAVTAFKDDSAAFDAVQGTDLCKVAAAKLSETLSAVDRAFDTHKFDIHQVEEIQVNWMEAHHLFRTLAPEARQDFEGKNELVAFFSWLDFCDDLIEKSHHTISEAILSSIARDFFHQSLETGLFPEPERGEERTTKQYCLRLAIVAQVWLHIKSDGLAKAFTKWLLGCADDQSDICLVTDHPLKRRLIQLCTSKNDELALESLRLFEVLLDRPCQPILETLLLDNLETRGYYHSDSAEAMSSWSDEEDERERVRNLSTSQPDKVRKSPPSSMTEPRNMVNGSRTFAPANIGKVINLWLLLYPDDLRVKDEGVSSSYEQYVSNAEAQFNSMLESCHGFDWPLEAVCLNDRPTSQTSSSDSKPEADSSGSRRFYEGDFLSMLFSMVREMIFRSYDINLQLTAIISKLALLPHPNVHEFLLNPTLPQVEERPFTSLFASLQSVLLDGKNVAEKIPSLQRKILACKKNLLGSPQIVSSSSDKSELSLNEDETRLIDALIVLEEFCKELAAIALVKYQFASSD